MEEYFQSATANIEEETEEKNETYNHSDLSKYNNSLLNTLLYTLEESEISTENMTEVIIISNFTELERMPRDNDGQAGEGFERLEGPYHRLQAQYGGWENSGLKYKISVQVMIFIVVNICL